MYLDKIKNTPRRVDMETKKKFEVADVLSLASCTIFESRGTRGLEEILEYMTGLSMEEYNALTPVSKKNLLKCCIMKLEEVFGFEGIQSPPCFLGYDMEWVAQVSREYQLPELLEIPTIQ